MVSYILPRTCELDNHKLRIDTHVSLYYTTGRSKMTNLFHVSCQNSVELKQFGLTYAT